MRRGQRCRRSAGSRLRDEGVVVVTGDKNKTDLAGAMKTEVHAIQSSETPLALTRTIM